MHCWITAFAPEQAAITGPPSTFLYETDAQRHNLIKENDLVIFYHADRVAAAAQVESIQVERHSETIPCCPLCKVARIQIRKRKPQRPFRCFYGHEFATPDHRTKDALLHAAVLSPHYAQITADIAIAELRPFEFTSSRHVKLRSADLVAVCTYIARRDRRAAPIFQNWLDQHHKEISENSASRNASSPSLPAAVDLAGTGTPHCGSNALRDKLIARYGARCMISGSTVLTLLRGCPVSRHQVGKDIHPANGIILRADLCNLFDLNLIGLDPETLELTVHAALSNTEYQSFSGRRLIFARYKRVDMRAIRRRWEEFLKASAEAPPASAI